ncbi:hypothetical protein F5Y17DRAFT_292239 [Xylariaceae sp. FL0594]|nr:hypothetical protein F5Y17DRAFT_292239 [Xylariaceae sp. FL0594]
MLTVGTRHLTSLDSTHESCRCTFSHLYSLAAPSDAQARSHNSCESPCKSILPQNSATQHFERSLRKMSDPAYVVMPIRADELPSRDNPNEVAHAIEESLNEKLHTDHRTRTTHPTHTVHPAHPAQPARSSRTTHTPQTTQTTHPTNLTRTSGIRHGAGPEQELEHQHGSPGAGPLKNAITNQDSLYKYISWDSPTRTFGSYLGLMSLLYILHHLHTTQLLLKMSATSLGAISLISFLSRSTGSDFVAHSRPQYKKVPEETLNATLRDIHDFVQYLALKLQRIVYGEDLGSTFTSCLILTTLFWLVKVMSPFSLVVLGLSTIYLVPLLGTPRGRSVAEGAKIQVQHLAQSTADGARVMARDGREKAVDLSSRAQHTVSNISGNVSSKTKSTADSITNKARQTSHNLTAASNSRRERRRSSSSAHGNTKNGRTSSDIGTSFDTNAYTTEANTYTTEANNTQANLNTTRRATHSTHSISSPHSFAAVAAARAEGSNESGSGIGRAESAGDVVSEERQRSLFGTIGNDYENDDEVPVKEAPLAADISSRGDLSSTAREVAEEIRTRTGGESTAPGYQSTTATSYRGGRSS